MRKLIIFFVALLTLQVNAQEQVTSNLLSYVETIINNAPHSGGSNEYQVPTTEQLDIFKNVIRSMVNEDYATANTIAEGIGYKVVQLLDTNGTTHYILQNNSTNYWGTFIFNPTAERENLIIQSPHSFYDSYTGLQGILVHRVAKTFAFFMNGTHRCNSTSYSVCDGTTTACGSSGPYRVSDQAHNINNTFQAATQVLEEEMVDPIYIQLHGFSKGSTDPYLIMSNGTSYQPAGTDYIALLRDALLNIDGVLTFKIAHIDTDWTRLIATTNTQGRLVNGSSNPCSSSATQNVGRFIHIEQERSRLRDSETDRLKMANAVIAAFPATSTAIEDYCEVEIQNDIRMYPNPFNSMTNIIFSIAQPGNVEVALYDILGRKLATLYDGFASPGNHTILYEADHLGSGIYFVLFNSNQGAVTRKITYIK